MNPVEEITRDRNEARNDGDRNADICFLALASKDGKASVRTLVLRDIVQNRFILFINQTSPKWQLLSNGADYEILLWYPSRQRQYRIHGDCEIVDESLVKTNWHRRPDGPKYMDYLYRDVAPQSSFIDNRQDLVSEIDQIKSNHPVADMTPPAEVTGVELVANRIEILDLNSEDRIHDRRLFTLLDDGWHVQVMIP
ncbi:MAG: pyridoxamine 5'-phosphate oxidase family protein [bacterium]|nr:hypothetical protein [Gammaproteobacteria bacterium]HIL94647.1 hypothetical protein [Pseudomonadales bacterium]